MALRRDDVDLERDRSLVLEFQAGNAGAFDDLYRRYYPRLYRFCLKRVSSAHDAEEIAQEAFVRAYSAMGRFAGERRFYPWLTVIAGRLCIDTHRRTARTSPAAEVDPGVTDGGQDDIVKAVDFELLDLALARLLPRHREVLDLRERRGWSYRQIAEHYDVSLSTVEMVLFRARQALRREFEAVSGGTSLPAFVPLAGLAAAARPLVWLRRKLRMLTPAGGGLPPVVAPALSAALVIGSAMVVASPPPLSTHTFQPRSPVAVAPAAHAPAPSTGSTATASAAAPAAPRTSGVDVTPPPNVSLGGTEIVSGQDGRDRAADAPLSGDLGIVVVGVNPQAIATDARTTASNYVGGDERIVP